MAIEIIDDTAPDEMEAEIFAYRFQQYLGSLVG